MRNKIVTIPNIITLLRLILIPFIVYFIIEKQAFYALIFFIIAVISDFLDGNLARLLNQESAFGKVFDPFIDFLLILCPLIALYLIGYINFIQFILFNLQKPITFFLLLAFKKRELFRGNFLTSYYQKLSVLFNFILIILLILKAGYYIVLVDFFLIYSLASVHWYLLYKNKKTREFETLFDR